MLAVWARFFRIRLLPTALLNALTGVIAAGGAGIATPPLELALAGAVVAALYLVGMGANDLADRERDREHAPGRPLPSGRLGVRPATLAVLTAGAAGAAAAAFLPAATWGWSAAILLAILLYDLGTKDHAWLGPLAMGSVRALVVLFGASLAGDPGAGLLPALVIGGHGFWTTRYSLEEERARPAVLASRARAILAHTLASAALAAALIAPAPLLLLAGWGAPIIALARASRRRAAASAGRFTLDSLCALPLLDAALQLSYDSPVTAALCGFVHLAILPRRPPDPAIPSEPEPRRESLP